MLQKKLEQIQGFHLEPTNICTLKCAGCARTRFIENWPKHWKNHSIDIDQLFKFLDIDLTGKKFTLCGNYGDPIYHPEFHNLIDRLKKTNACVSLITNGSYRDEKWWQKLSNLLDHRDIVTFSIDGLPENFTTYRVNADWESIRVGIDAMTASQCKTAWKFIPFAYNELDITAAEQLSIDLGIDKFLVDPSDRFDEKTEFLRPTIEFIGKRFDAQAQFKNSIVQPVDPKCNQNREHFISADGHYIPCCYAADHRFYYKNEFGKNRQQYHIATTTLSQLLAAPAVVNFYDTVQSQSVCQFNCPAL